MATIKDLPNQISALSRAYNVMAVSSLRAGSAVYKAYNALQPLGHSFYKTASIAAQYNSPASKLFTSLGQIAIDYSSTKISVCSGFSSALRCACTSNFLIDATRASVSVSKSFFDSMALAKDLAEQLTFPPVYSLSSVASEVKSKALDPVSGNFTPEFHDLSDEICRMPLTCLDYAFDESGNIVLSDELDEKLSDSIGVGSSTADSKNKRMPKDFFVNVALPVILTALQLAYGIYSDKQLTHRIEQHHQETVSIQLQVLEEEQRQTEYLRKIVESAHANSK